MLSRFQLSIKHIVHGQHSYRIFSSYLSSGLKGILTSEEETLLNDQSNLTSTVRALAERIGIHKNDSNILDDFLPLENHGFSIVVAGEFNAGKSSIINALLGQKLLETGALPTTESITILTHSKSQSMTETHLQGGLVWHQVSSIPEGIILVDTPGTNAVIEDHTLRTTKLLPIADLILFCTSADRPFPESERQLLQSIQAYRKNIIIIINKMDDLDSSGGNHGQLEKDRVVQFVSEHASIMLGGRPVVIPISAKDALASKLVGANEVLWNRSNFQEFEHFLKESLTSESKLKAKLLNPVGVGEGILKEGLERLRQEEIALQADIATLDLLNAQFESWSKEMATDAKLSCQELKQLFQTEGHRVKNILERAGTISVLNWCLLHAAKWEAEWKRSIVQNLDIELTDRIQHTSTTISNRAQSQGQAVIDYLGKRPSQRNNDIVGHVVAASQFEDIRTTLQEQMQANVKAILSHYNKDASQEAIFKSLRFSASMVLLLQSSALLSVTLAYLDVVSSFSGGVYGVSSACLSSILAFRSTSNASNQYSKEWDRLGLEAHESFLHLTTKELVRVKSRILGGVKPYSRYVETERDRISTLVKECEDTISDARSIRNRINKLRRYE
jgi:small GTP-binding protein